MVTVPPPRAEVALDFARGNLLASLAQCGVVLLKVLAAAPLTLQPLHRVGAVAVVDHTAEPGRPPS
jgi:hypothetical protein